MTEQPTEQTTEATGTQATGEEEPRCAFPKCPARPVPKDPNAPRSEEHTSELQSQSNLVCRLLLEKKKKIQKQTNRYRQQTRYNIDLQHRPHTKRTPCDGVHTRLRTDVRITSESSDE